MWAEVSENQTIIIIIIIINCNRSKRRRRVGICRGRRRYAEAG
jgi:hypothetical protein